MALHSQIEQAVCEAFWAAYLLLTDVQSAEAAVMDAIERLDVDDFSGDTLFACIADLAIERSRHHRERNPDRSPATLPTAPSEFSAVLRLPILQRQCFVLRLLLGMPEEACARLLCIAHSDLIEFCAAAISELAARRCHVMQTADAG